MKFKLEIECDNAAFNGGEREDEIARILSELSHKLEDGEWGGCCSLYDINGNRVGVAVVTK